MMTQSEFLDLYYQPFILEDFNYDPKITNV